MVENHNCTCEDETQFIESQNVSYWRKEGEDEKWPKCPTTPLMYRRVCSAGKTSPYCIYALVHRSYVKASSLFDDDKHKFPYKYCNCDVIFADYLEKLNGRKAEAIDLKKNLCFNSVVPEKYIHDELDSFKCEVDAIVYGSFEDTGTVPGKIVGDLQKSIAKFVTNLRSMTAFEICEERQLNIWMNRLLKPIISSYGFMLKQRFSNNMYSLFGTSRPNLAFFKTSKGNIVAGVVDVQGEDKEEHVDGQENLVQGTIEYKKNATEEYRTHCYANLVRVANDSVIESLESGILVRSVTVYGLLVAHTDYDCCLPMKYFSNFKDPPTIQLGPTRHFAELIYCILQS